MATIIQIKRSSGTTAPSTLKLGEIAYTHRTGTQGDLGDRLFLPKAKVTIRKTDLLKEYKTEVKHTANYYRALQAFITMKSLKM